MGWPIGDEEGEEGSFMKLAFGVCVKCWRKCRIRKPQSDVYKTVPLFQSIFSPSI